MNWLIWEHFWSLRVSAMFLWASHNTHCDTILHWFIFFTAFYRKPFVLEIQLWWTTLEADDFFLGTRLEIVTNEAINTTQVTGWKDTGLKASDAVHSLSLGLTKKHKSPSSIYCIFCKSWNYQIIKMKHTMWEYNCFVFFVLYSYINFTKDRLDAFLSVLPCNMKGFVQKCCPVQLQNVLCHCCDSAFFSLKAVSP